MISFKEEEKDVLRGNFEDPNMDSRLKTIIFSLDGYVHNKYHKDITITSIYREQDEGVHHYWRGIDVRSTYFTDDEIRDIVKFLNDNFIYGNGKQTCIYHTVGRGWHLHIQVNSNNNTILIKQ